MEIVNSKLCEKHNLQAKLMCTTDECFKKLDISVCKQCLPKHSHHQNNIIEVSLLNEKVHELMKKRMEFQVFYEQSCEAMVTELKKFKMFKQEIVNHLNFRERCLNEACKKIRKNIPYEKDKQLFKNHLGYVYLAMKGINLNIDLYRNFKSTIFETINQCHKAIRKFELNFRQVPMFNIKDHQICSILKKVKQQSISPIVYYQPSVKQFKKQTLKINPPNINHDWKLQRISQNEFISFSKDTNYAKWYDVHNFHYPKVLPIGFKITNMQILSKNAYMTDETGAIVIYDLLNQKIVKQFACSTHKNASITKLLPISHRDSHFHILNFITNPNQIVILNYDDDKNTLKMVKGIQTKQKCTDAISIQDKFIASFYDKVVRLYNVEHLEVESQLQFDEAMHSIASIDNNTYTLAGQSNYISIVDTRVKGIVCKIPTENPSTQIKKVYPNSIMSIYQKTLKLYDLKVQKQMFSSKTQEYMRHIEIINSDCFLTSGKHLTLWNGLP